MSTIGPTTEKLWRQYLDAEKNRVRLVMLPALERFIDALLGESKQSSQQWALDFAVQVSDMGTAIPLRHPLLVRVLLPALTDGVLSGTPGCLRWLARLGQGYPPDIRLPEHLQTPVGLLREAIRIDPTDQIARDRLLQIWAESFEYSLHELPAGVLYGYNGATIPECEELLVILQEFRDCAAGFQQPSRFAELIADCDLHFRGYREYLTQERPSGSYKQFCETRGLPGHRTGCLGDAGT